MPEKFFLKTTCAVAIAGAIHKAGSIIEVAEDLAKDLLRRGKAELATVEAEIADVLGGDYPPLEPDDAAPNGEGQAPEPAPTDKPAKPAK